MTEAMTTSAATAIKRIRTTTMENPSIVTHRVSAIAAEMEAEVVVVNATVLVAEAGETNPVSQVKILMIAAPNPMMTQSPIPSPHG